MRIIERGTSNLISISENSVDVAIFSVASLIACQTLGYVLIKILFSRPKKESGGAAPQLILLPDERARFYFFYVASGV